MSNTQPADSGDLASTIPDDNPPIDLTELTPAEFADWLRNTILDVFGHRMNFELHVIVNGVTTTTVNHANANAGAGDHEVAVADDSVTF